RYWLAEHHAIAALADPCPEVLVARLGAETSRLRIGTGGVLLPYYSAFRTAEAFRMLEALYPGRIDLGGGRAPGRDARTARAGAANHGLLVRHLRRGRRGRRAPSAVDRPAAAAHGAQYRRPGADARGGRGPRVHRRRARIRRAAARPGGDRWPAPGAAGARG